jgi:predicted transcriptional regulator
MDKEFIVKKNKTESVTFTIRIDKDIQEQLDKVAEKANRSRNYLINKALRYAIENIKLEDD